VRIESETPVQQSEIFEVCTRLAPLYTVCSVELLQYFGEERGYSLAQGQ